MRMEYKGAALRPQESQSSRIEDRGLRSLEQLPPLVGLRTDLTALSEKERQLCCLEVFALGETLLKLALWNTELKSIGRVVGE